MQRYFSYIYDGQADWRRNWTYGRASNAIYISQGSLTGPSKHRHEATPMGIRRICSCLKPQGPHGGTTLSWVYWCFTSHATIFQSYMWQHRCAGGLKKLYLRSGSQRHRHFVGFFNVPVLHRHVTTLFIRWFRHNAPFSRLFTTRWGYGGHIIDLSPPASSRGYNLEEIFPRALYSY